MGWYNCNFYCTNEVYSIDAYDTYIVEKTNVLDVGISIIRLLDGIAIKIGIERVII